MTTLSGAVCTMYYLHVEVSLMSKGLPNVDSLKRWFITQNDPQDVTASYPEAQDIDHLSFILICLSNKYELRVVEAYPSGWNKTNLLFCRFRIVLFLSAIYEKVVGLMNWIY
jgi:hypothetical protein